MIDERRRHIRFPVMRNVGEPVELKVAVNQKKVVIPGYIANLSEGGMGIITLGLRPSDLGVGTSIVLDLQLPNMSSHHVEGKVVRFHISKKAHLHHSHEEWFMGLQFTKISASAADHIHRMAEDWSLCEAKVEMGLPDICDPECCYLPICEKSAKLKN